MSRSIFLLIIALLLLYGCTTKQTHMQYTSKSSDLPSTEIKTDTKKMAIIVPLSGSNKQIGENIIKASLMAIKNFPNVEALVFDSELLKNSPLELKNSIERNNVKYVLGPVFGEEATEFAKLTNNKITCFTFSNNPKISDRNLVTTGLSPIHEVKALLQHAIDVGRTKIIMFIPRGEYGDIINQAIDQFEENDQISIKKIRYKKLLPGDIQNQLSEIEFDATFFAEPIDQIPHLPGLLVLCPHHFYKDGTQNSVAVCVPNQNSGQEFFTLFQKNFGFPPDVFAFIGFDIANVIYSMLTNEDSSFRDSSYSGTMGNFTFDMQGNISRELKVYENQYSL